MKKPDLEKLNKENKKGINEIEYPSLVFAGPNIIILSDGDFKGKFYILAFNDKKKLVTLLKIISKEKIILKNSNNTSNSIYGCNYEKNVLPSVLLHAKIKTDDSGILLLGYTYDQVLEVKKKSKTPQSTTTKLRSSSSTATKSKIEFYISLCEIEIDLTGLDMGQIHVNNPLEDTTDMRLLSSVKGNDIPLIGAIEDSIKGNGKAEGSFIVLSENEPYTEFITFLKKKSEEDELANTGSSKNEEDNSSKNENEMDVDVDSNLDETIPSLKKKKTSIPMTTLHPLTYKWYQETDDLTFYLRIPETNKKNIVCTFQHNHLYLKIKKSQEISGTKLNRVSSHPGIGLDKIGQDTDMELYNDDLWDEVVSDECLWTIEKANSKTSSGCIITLHLEKKNKIKWIQLFKNDDKVLETVDPSELLAIKEHLMMYTGGTMDMDGSMDNSPYQKINSITQTEECDLQKSCINFIRANSTGQITDINQGTGFEWLCTSFPTVSMNSNSNYIMNYVCLKQDVDGVIFELESRLKLNHCAVFNALGFVEASKRNKKYTFISQDFEYALIAETSKMIYIYQQPIDEEEEEENEEINIDNKKRKNHNENKNNRNTASQYLVDVSNPALQNSYKDEDQLDELIQGMAQLGPNTFVVLKKNTICIFSI